MIYFGRFIFPLFPVLTHDEKKMKMFGCSALLDCVDCIGADTSSENDSNITDEIGSKLV